MEKHEYLPLYLFIPGQFLFSLVLALLVVLVVVVVVVVAAAAAAVILVGVV